jgi:hypothetical protein
VVDTDVFSPIVEQPNPVTEGSNFCNFTRHMFDSPQQKP